MIKLTFLKPATSPKTSRRCAAFKNDSVFAYPAWDSEPEALTPLNSTDSDFAFPADEAESLSEAELFSMLQSLPRHVAHQLLLEALAEL